MKGDQMNFVIRIATEKDIDELEVLYDALNDHLAAGVNYPGWLKGIYPVRGTAAQGIAEGCLYVAVCDDLIIGSIILRRGMEPIYQKAAGSCSSRGKRCWWCTPLSYIQIGCQRESARSCWTLL